MNVPANQDPFCIHADGEIVYANEPCLSMFGSESPEETIGDSLFAFIAEPYHDALIDQFAQLTAGEADALGLSAELTPQTGSTHEVVLMTSPIQWNGETKLQTTVIDVANQLAAEPVVHRAVQTAPIGITVADMTTEDEPLIYVSDSFVEMTGYPRDEALGRNCRFLQGEATREEPVEKMRTAINAGESVTVVLRNHRKNGSMFWNRVTLTPIRNTNGELTHFLGYQEDVSELKLYEREKSLFEKHAAAAPYAMLVTNREGTIEYVNPAFERATGYRASEAIGQNPRILKSDQQDEEFFANLWETITAGETWEDELINRRKSGELYRVHQTIVPITDEYGEITHFVAIERDISQTEFTEQVLDVVNRILRHNLRTSINVIEGFATILEEEVDDPKLLEAAKTINDRAVQLQKISEKTTGIRQLFDDREQQQLIDVDTVVGYISQLKKRYPEASIETVVEATDPVQVRNGALLKVAIEEAIENAVEHDDTDEPTVSVTLSTTKDPAELRIAIADTGPGIPKSEWDVIVANEETPLRHASGIGLWLIYWSITALGGAVELSRNEPRGSVLTLRVPIIGDSAVDDTAN